MEFLKEWVVWIFSYLADVTYALGQGVLALVIGSLPSNSAPDWQDSFQGYFETLDAWMPATEAIAIFATYVTFSITLITARWIIKFIPLIG